jgi:hypothetical protein
MVQSYTAHIGGMMETNSSFTVLLQAARVINKGII